MGKIKVPFEQPYRCLRKFRRLAMRPHTCSICGRSIIGEDYDCEISIDRFGFRVTKTHALCPAEFWEEEEAFVRRIDVLEQEKAISIVCVALTSIAKLKRR